MRTPQGPHHLYRWTFSNIVGALFGALQLTGIVWFLAALLYALSFAATGHVINGHEALLTWASVLLVVAVIATIFAIIAQITNGERW